MTTEGGIEMPYTTKSLKVPDFGMQRGSTCGLYALEGVIRALDPTTKYRATKDHKNPDTTMRTTKEYSLRYIAKHKLKKTATVIGEIFHAAHLKELAEYIGLKADLHTKTDWKVVIKNAISSGKYVIAPFGVNNTPGPQQGQPQTGGGAHYCVVFAYAFWFGAPPKTKVKMPFMINEWWSPKDDPSLLRSYVIVRHWNKNRRFYIEEFRKSSQALKKWPEQYWKKKQGTKKLGYEKVGPWGQKYSLFRPSGAKKIPEADLPKTLADKLVVVGK